MTVIDRPAADEAAQGAEPAGDELRELVVEGHEQGYLTAGHIADALRDVELTTDQIEAVFSRLADEGIDVLEGDEPADEVGAVRAQRVGGDQARTARRRRDRDRGE